MSGTRVTVVGRRIIEQLRARVRELEEKLATLSPAEKKKPKRTKPAKKRKKRTAKKANAKAKSRRDEQEE